jgi:hypothetical protein
MAALPKMGQPGDYEPRTWPHRQAELRMRVAKSNPAKFLEWSVVHDALFVGNAPAIKHQLADLLRGDWKRWRRGVEESDFGNPARLPACEKTSGNMVHQAYILKQWETVAGERVESLNSIFEFGGGYGAMARLCNQLGFEGAYCIYDLPELSLLQEFYLSNTGVENVVFTQEPIEEIVFDLFIAACSLSEVEFELRDEILDSIEARSYVIMYQGAYDGRNNREYFESWAETKPDLEWHRQRMDFYPHHQFLIGVS